MSRLVHPAWLLLLAGAAALAANPEDGITSQPLAPRSTPRGTTMFTLLAPDETGVRTTNDYRDPRMWGDRYHEFELGAIGTGIAIGDYDGDGRPDIFVVSKTESCRLFRNLGGCKFEDVTDKAGVGDTGDAAMIWKQGAAFADVNNDGKLDLYVCRFGAPNLLYINQGDGTFKEMARAYGLDVSDASSTAAFCDYDRDGWLDLYLLTNLLDNAAHPGGQPDRLFHNNRNDTFTDVTVRAGLATGDTQGNSATWWDYNNDGWPDLYVANDFAAPDYLYRNNRDGTFTNVIDRTVPHTSYSSMGADTGDLNNDGLVDLMVADMAATTHQKDQRTMAETRSRGKDPDDGSPAVPNYLRNTVFLNTGTDRVLEAAFLAGLAATDWTWSVRFEDLDNDGRLDLHVTNGMHREIHNVDLMQRMMVAESAAERVRIARSSPVLAEPNLAFRNLGDLRFESVGAAWGLDQKGVSFGAAFADLDGDGDLDLVFANYLGGVTILRNDGLTGHQINVDLRGTVSNRFGVGATVRIETAAGVQVRQLVVTRGSMSSSEPMLHFGLGDDTTVRSLEVRWPSGLVQRFTHLAADRRYTITEPAGPPHLEPPEPPPPSQFEEVSAATGLAATVHEETIDEEAQQHLLPVRLNRRGPALAVGDADGDQRDDLVVGGTTLDGVRLIRAVAGSRFEAGRDALAGRGAADDGPVLLFDADGDGRNDLLVTRGGNSLPDGAPEMQPVLLLGTGRGFTPAPAGALPPLALNVGAVAAADFDGDGGLDVFLGGRVRPGRYPLAPRSALLANRGGRFEDVTDAVAPGLREVGMVTSAVWCDVDGDGRPDLVLALEWGTVKYFHNDGGRLSDWTDRSGFAAAGTGWWTGIAVADFNGDGRPDFAVGNAGLNTQYHADADHPAVLFYGEFEAGVPPLAVEGYFEDGQLYPWRSRKELAAALPSIRRRFPRNDIYARATLAEILGAERLAAARKFTATELRSGVLLSQPDGTYRYAPLPRLAQVAPVQGIVAGDFDGDGHTDLCVVQNSYAPPPVVGRFDGGLGALLHGDGQGNFSVVPLPESGLVVPGDAKALVVADLDGDGRPDFIVSRNNDTLLAFRNRGQPGGNFLRVTLRGPAGNPTAVGAVVTLVLADGSTQTGGIEAGAGYYSQSSPACSFGYPDGNPPARVRVRWPSGRSTEQGVPGGTHVLAITDPAAGGAAK
ncbi:MAG TPA: FG-GAP-like repeat-containing protein [Lacunisphaera sp.]|nr:FG-GAP-like repeat-containing protein [Lacunisphaera sp.]